ncbi:hypothetical protein N599_31295 [Saccharopolyspora erythraea D]|nr:hypothetical protein N599_31295 [Saccharopolyspora erythraea D]
MGAGVASWGVDPACAVGGELACIRIECDAGFVALPA